MSVFSSLTFNKSTKSTEKHSRIKFAQSNFNQSLSKILDLLPEILPNILETIAN